MKLIKRITAVLMALMLFFSAVPYAFQVHADDPETDGTACPEGDGDTVVFPTYLAGTQVSLDGKTAMNPFDLVKAMLEKAGKGYSQQNRYDVNYYDCSSLVQRCFRDLGITGNVPASTYYWYEMLENSPVGDIVTFYGSNRYIQYRLTAKNIAMQGNESYFAKPGTIIVLIAPNLCTGHICVSLGAFARQDTGLDPIADRSTIIANTENYVAAQLEARYGVPATLFTNPGAVSGVRSIWVDDKNLGEDMTTKEGGQSGVYNPIWRVEAFNPSKGVCVDNCAHGTNYTLNVRYVLEPLDNITPIVSPPEITDVTVSNVTSEGYRVTATFTAPAGLKEVLMPTWTEANGQDDLQWHVAGLEDANVASFDVKVSDHNNEAGAYITHIYVTDILNRKAIAGVNVEVPETIPEPTEPEDPTGPEDPDEPEEPPTEPEVMGFTEAYVSDVTSEGYMVHAEFIAPNGVSEILMPTWTEANGQDDLIWHKASTTDGKTVQFYVRTADHKNESGLYITHIYVKDPKGNEIIAGVSADVPEPEPEEQLAITHVEATEFSLGGGYHVGITYTAPKGVREVLMPTWTEKNGQDDLVWHKAEVHEESNTAGLYINISDHNNELGVYHTHIYLYDNTGACVIEPITITVTKEYTPLSTKPMIKDLVISDVTQHGYRVTVKIMSVYPIQEVLMPTWTEKNGQDDLIWYNAIAYEQINSDYNYMASRYIPISEHNDEKGQYITHVYVTNNKGEQVIAATGAVLPTGESPVPELKITDLEVTELSSEGFRVTATFTAPDGVSEVLMPTWTEANGQDDLIWHKAQFNGNMATFYVRKADHKNESGQYITHVYVKDTKGKQVIAATGAVIPQESAPVDPTKPTDPVQPENPVTPAGTYVFNGLDFAPVFNPEYYLAQYPDLKQAFGSNASQAFSHFVNNGIYEGRVASPYFSVTVYRDRYLDLRNAFGNNLMLYVQHYLTCGMQEGRSGK